ILQLEEKLMQSESLDFNIHKGRLAPPVNGRILNRFGRVRSKQLDSYVVSNGINFKAPKGTPVRAVYSGQVLYTGSLEGYGNLLIIGHGGNYHSVYGHLDKIIAKTGKNVGRGEVVALSGDSGSIIGETLYFEMRHNGQAIEPTTWFRLAKK
ncbi:MAG: murein hydrolase activator EnvC family protein, partial [Nitrospinales bacterium]